MSITLSLFSNFLFRFYQKSAVNTAWNSRPPAHWGFRERFRRQSQYPIPAPISRIAPAMFPHQQFPLLRIRTKAGREAEKQRIMSFSYSAHFSSFYNLTSLYHALARLSTLSLLKSIKITIATEKMTLHSRLVTPHRNFVKTNIPSPCAWQSSLPIFGWGMRTHIPRRARRGGKLENIIGNTIVPMYVGFTINGQRFIFRKHFCPQLFVTIVCPIIFVKSAPQDSATVLVKILL